MKKIIHLGEILRKQEKYHPGMKIIRIKIHQFFQGEEGGRRKNSVKSLMGINNLNKLRSYLGEFIRFHFLSKLGYCGCLAQVRRLT